MNFALLQFPSTYFRSDGILRHRGEYFCGSDHIILGRLTENTLLCFGLLIISVIYGFDCYGVFCFFEIYDFVIFSSAWFDWRQWVDKTMYNVYVFPEISWFTSKLLWFEPGIWTPCSARLVQGRLYRRPRDALTKYQRRIRTFLSKISTISALAGPNCVVLTLKNTTQYNR